MVLSDAKRDRKLMQGMTEEQAKIMAELDKAKMEKMDAYIAIRNSDNIFESTDVPQETSAMFNRVYSAGADIQQLGTLPFRWKWSRFSDPQYSGRVSEKGSKDQSCFQ